MTWDHMNDEEVQYQRHRPPRILYMSSKLNVPGILTPAFNNLFRFDSVRGAKKVRKLVNRPVVRLFGTRVSGTRT